MDTLDQLRKRAGLRVNDGNLGFTVSTGTGVNVIGWAKSFPIGLFARWDTYWMGFRDVRRRRSSS